MEPITLPPGIHARNGFCFQRTDDGSVHVRLVVPVLSPAAERHDSPDGGQAVLFQAVLPANEWASIVAAVSAKGENFESYNEALRYHDNSAEADLEP